MANVNLEMFNGRKVHINREYLQPYEEELLSFLEGQDYMQTLKFAKTMMMGQEIKSNNNIEGINDDLSVIDEVIKKRVLSLPEIQRKRIINLYHGYKYILSHKIIDKEHLKELYALLSDDLLEPTDKNRMGEYYRCGMVYILKSLYLDNNYFTGCEVDKIDYYMDQFFDFVNNGEMEHSNIDVFIKSQIMHFYFVYIHPYFDVNGRTSRTVSMWYLLNNKCYPYIIFNRAIVFARKDYENNIIKGRAQGDLTLFLKYMITSVEKELEKEYVIHSIGEYKGINLTDENCQMLEYLLVTNSNLTVKDLINTYKNYNNHKKVKEIFEEKILPLIDKNILIRGDDTKSFIARGVHNMRIFLNPDVIQVNPDKVKHLSLTRYTK